jgi:hypothetical protein
MSVFVRVRQVRWILRALTNLTVAEQALTWLAQRANRFSCIVFRLQSPDCLGRGRKASLNKGEHRSGGVLAAIACR